MKRKHLLLFITACLLLYISDIFAAGLIALALIFQMNILFEKITLTKASQLGAFKQFLTSIPVFFFLGGIHSFIYLYAASSQWLFLLFAAFVAFCLFFVVNFLTFFSFSFLPKNDFKIWMNLQYSVQNVPHKKRGLLVQTSVLFFLSFVPLLNTEWKIIFSLTVFQLYLHRGYLKQVFDSSR